MNDQENLRKQILMCLASNSGVKIELIHDSTINLYHAEVKPILFDLSNLTKPITIKGVNDGKPFVPEKEINRTCNLTLGNFSDWRFEKESLTIISNEAYDVHIEDMMFIIEQLIKWNFNIYLKPEQYISATNEYES